jgi:hypothetical protein
MFQETSMIYLMALTPFDCVSIKMDFEALCLPGMGLPRYAAIARVLIEVLPQLLPKMHTHVTSLVNMVCVRVTMSRVWHALLAVTKRTLLCLRF